MSNESDKDEEMSSDVDVLEVDVYEDFDLSLEGVRKLHHHHHHQSEVDSDALSLSD